MSRSGQLPRQRPAPITSELVLHRIKARIALMRWSKGLEDEKGEPREPSPIVPGSLADEFWNKDIPRLVAQVERNLHDERAQLAPR